MNDDQNSNQHPDDDIAPVPPLAGHGADPTLPGGADPTAALPATSPTYTTGPGSPPPASTPGPGAAESRSGSPAWLLPAVAGAGVALLLAGLAFFVLGGDDDETVSTDATVTTIGETAPAATIAAGEPESNSTNPAEPVESAEPAAVEPTDSVPESTDAPASAPTTAASTAPCAAGYTDVTSVPFGLCSQGEIVSDAQRLISQYADITIDGEYGPGTFAEVQILQTSFGFEPNGTITQEFLDALSGVVPASDFTVALEGSVLIGDEQFPIVRQCRTVPLEGFTGAYSVVSHVYENRFGGFDVIDRWFDEGGANGIYTFADTGPVTDLDAGFGFELFEGDGFSTVSVNPLPNTDESCIGTVTEVDDAGEQIRIFGISTICVFEGTTRLQLSESATVDIDGTTVDYYFPNDGDSFSGSDTNVIGGVIDPTRVQLVASPTDGSGAVRTISIDYPDAGYPNC